MDQARRTADSDALLARASRLSHRDYQRLPAAEFGIRWVENYILSEQPLEEMWEHALVRDLYPEERELRETGVFREEASVRLGEPRLESFEKRGSLSCRPRQLRAQVR